MRTIARAQVPVYTLRAVSLGGTVMRCSHLAILVTTSLAMSAGAFADDTGFAYSHNLRKEGGRLCMSDHYHSGSGSGRGEG